MILEKWFGMPVVCAITETPKWFLPTVLTDIIGPGQPELAHQTDEWCLVNGIEQSVEIFKRIMREYKGL